MIRIQFVLQLFLLVIVISSQIAHATATMDKIAGQPQASEFSLDSINGSKASLSDYRGKFVLINFWATWCAPCRKEMPSMNNLYDQLKANGLVVIGVHVGPSKAGVKKFLDQVPVNFTILVDKDMSLVNWGVRGLPTTFLINPEGKLIYQAVGEREWDSPEMINFLKSLIQNYERMAEGEAQTTEPKKSFFVNLKETLGWSCEHENKKQQLLPN